MIKETRPGIYKGLDLSILQKEEELIINKLSKNYWYVTRVSSESLGKCEYRVVLIKPTKLINETFNIYREVVLIFSSYEKFEPRVFDVLDNLKIQDLRVEEICCIIVSNDKDVASSIKTILSSNKESRVFVPFTYQELSVNNIDDVVINKMRNEFFSRDLFDIQNALKKELYFFGRRNVIQELICKHESNENCGIFGLRKTGKTSILYGIQRTLNRKESTSIIIDCQTLHLKSWNHALRFIVDEACKLNNISKKMFSENEKYDDESTVAEAFKEDIMTFLQKSKKNLLLIFDEIENISFGTSATSDWREGMYFVKFWQVIRSTCQSNSTKRIFSFLIAGTNPRCVEIQTINKTDNPIFQQFSPIYIEPFSFTQTKEMIDRLGGFMGLKFPAEVCTHIVEDFGGHPLLMRQICSFIHKKLINSQRPISINKADYNSYKQKFYIEQSGFHQYAKMILEVLTEWYGDEYQMLKWLAINDIDNFKECAQEPSFIMHLLNYGIIDKDNTSIGYHFKIEALKSYLEDINKYKRPILSDEEREQEIQERRSSIEKKLRLLVRRQLKSSLGEEDAKSEIIRGIYGPREINHKSNIPYKDFFDPSKHEIYLKTLFDVIIRKYVFFEKLFNANLDTFKSKSQLLNNYRRADAHSMQISDSDFETFRGIASWFETALAEE